MPSPPLILRSSSEPDFSTQSGTIPHPNRSYCSAPPLKSSWRTIREKLVSFGRTRKEHSNNSDLTEENLQEHTLRQEIMYLRNSKCSPYYKGLLALNRYKLVDAGTPASPSPGRESHATTVNTSSTSRSGFAVKMREWSFFLGKARRIPDSSSPNLAPLKTTLLKEMVMDRKTALKKSGGRALKANEKPLRERVSEADQQSGAVRNLRPRLSNTRAAGQYKEAAAASVTVQSQSLGGVSTGVYDRDSSDRSLAEVEFVWASRYRPKALKDFICNREIALSLQGQINKDVKCGHFIFQGLPGVGKRTMIWAMLREVFGPDEIQAREERKVFNLRGESKDSIKVMVRESTKHVEVSVSQLKGYEKHIIVELIKETHSKSSNKALQGPENCRAMILYEADRLSTDALLYIRWLLEKYNNTKVFFCCTDVSKLQPIRMLCSVMKLLPPSNEEIVQVLEFIAKQEHIDLPHRLAERIADSSKNNLRQAIRSFEASSKKSYRFTEDQVIMTGWEDDIAMIAKKIAQEQSSKQLYEIRRKLQLLYEHDVSPKFIFAFLVQELKKHLDDPPKHQVDSLYGEYNNDGGPPFESDKPLHFSRNTNEELGKTLNDSAKGSFQDFNDIEEFVARFMSWYKQWVSKMSENMSR